MDTSDSTHPPAVGDLPAEPDCVWWLNDHQPSGKSIKYNTITIAISHDGLAPKARVSRLPADQIHRAISRHVHRAVQLQLTSTLPEQLRQHRVDAVFPAAHGSRGASGFNH